MSLLGANVYANPTTPLWGGGGGGGSNVIPAGGSLTFDGSPDQALKLSDGNITVKDASDNYASFSTGEVRAYDNVGSYVALGTYSTQPLGIRAFQDDGALQNTFAQFDSGGWDLSNVSSINGVPYFNSPGTQFDYEDYGGGLDISVAPNWTTVNQISFTPPVNGKLFMETLGTFVAVVNGAGVGMSFQIDGVDAPVKVPIISQTLGNTNMFVTSMYQFAVTANVTYDIRAVAFRSGVPPEPDADAVITSSRMFLLFSPQ